MAELRLGGRCQRHPLNILPCEKCAVEQPQILTLRDVLHRLHALIGDGTQKAAAERLGVSQQYLSDVLNEAREPGPLILAGLGIERVVIYRDMRNTPGVAVRQTIDTADHVKHGPTGETWVVARVNGEHLHPCGWPPTRADLSDCTLVKKATPAEREKLLRDLSQGQTEHAGWAANALGVREDGSV